MSFQAYLDNIYAKTGKTADDFKAMANEKGLVKHTEIVAWLKTEYGLGLGHARAIVEVIQHQDEPELPVEDHVAKHFTGAKAQWRATYDDVYGRVSAFGPDVSVSTTSTYLSLLRDGKKFAIVQITSGRMDIGVKLKGTAAEGWLEAAGTWNPMVTHRVRISDPAQIDQQVITWLRQAYDRA